MLQTSTIVLLSGAAGLFKTSLLLDNELELLLVFSWLCQSRCSSKKPCWMDCLLSLQWKIFSFLQKWSVQNETFIEKANISPMIMQSLMNQVYLTTL